MSGVKIVHKIIRRVKLDVLIYDVAQQILMLHILRPSLLIPLYPFPPTFPLFPPPLRLSLPRIDTSSRLLATSSAHHCTSIDLQPTPTVTPVGFPKLSALYTIIWPSLSIIPTTHYFPPVYDLKGPYHVGKTSWNRRGECRLYQDRKIGMTSTTGFIAVWTHGVEFFNASRAEILW